MAWARWRGRRAELDSSPARPEVEGEPDPLDAAPIAILVLAPPLRVVRANAAARRMFGAESTRLPASLVELTREAHLEEAVRTGATERDVRLVHHGRVVRIDIVTGPDEERVVFITDVTELRRLETVRQEFVANLSHELKTPLTSLRLAAESLLGDPPPATRRRFAERAVREADHLVAIVENLRQLAEMEAGRINLKLQRFPLADLLREVVERARIERPLNLEIPSGLVVTADRDKLAQAIGNLLDNAAKFSPPGSAVDVTATVAAGELEIRVRDRGTGISPEHWDRVFERFYKVDPSRTRGVPGSGLGLAITKHLVLAHGGRVWTEVHPEGGQVFGMSLPARAEFTGP